MKKLIVAVAVLGWLGMASWCPAQQMARSPVVMVDLNHIMDNYTGFTEMQANLKTEFTVAENDLKSRSERVSKMAEQLKQLKKGSLDHQRLEENITKASHQWQLLRVQTSKKLAKRQAQMVYNVYQEVLGEITSYCRRSGARVALQFNSEQLKPEEYQKVLSRIQHPVLFAEPSIDITRAVLDQLNRRHAARNRGRAPRR